MPRLARRRLLWCLLVLPGFLLRALVAPGFMPMAGPDDSLSMQVCPGHAAVTAGDAFALATTSPIDGEQQRSSVPDSPCAFAATAGIGPSAASVAFVAASPPAVFLASPARVRQPFESHSPRQFPPRGPPPARA